MSESEELLGIEGDEEGESESQMPEERKLYEDDEFSTITSESVEEEAVEENGTELQEEEEEQNTLRFQYDGKSVVKVITSGDRAGNCGEERAGDTTSFHVLKAFKVSYLPFFNFSFDHQTTNAHDCFAS